MESKPLCLLIVDLFVDCFPRIAQKNRAPYYCPTYSQRSKLFLVQDKHLIINYWKTDMPSLQNHCWPVLCPCTFSTVRITLQDRNDCCSPAWCTPYLLVSNNFCSFLHNVTKTSSPRGLSSLAFACWSPSPWFTSCYPEFISCHIVTIFFLLFTLSVCLLKIP